MNTNVSTSGFVPSEDFTVDSSFSDFSLLYTGAYCLLYKAKRYGQWYVLKCLKDEFVSTLLYRELLKKEFDISISLSHPNIVRTIGWESVPAIGECIVMEYIEGVSLEKYLEEKHSSSEKARIIKGVIAALAYIHGRQIVHRDIKPANIMVTQNGGNAKLLDFGLSDTDSYCILKHPAGTDNYISPEQRNIPLPDCRNDIFSLGKVIRKANISWFYNYLGHRCIRSHAKRLANVERLVAYINSWERFVSSIPSLVLLVVAVVFVALYTYDSRQSDGRHVDYNAVIDAGKKEADRIFGPVKEFMAGKEDMSDEDYAVLSGMMEQASQEFQEAVDSLTYGMDQVSRSAAVNAIYLYYGEMWNSAASE